MDIKILHTADIQVQCRDKNLQNSYVKTLRQIEQIIEEQKIDIYVIAGDLFEYAISNEIEKKIMYQHLSRVLTSDLKELVIMNGNHDLVKLNHVKENEEKENSINTFVESILSFDKYSHKVNYLKYSKLTPSIACSKLFWLPISLEDGMPLKNSKEKYMNQLLEAGSCSRVITIFHDILKEYAIESKLPIQKSRLESLYSMNDFLTDFIIAGDIHLNWSYSDENGKKFIYPGSPIQRNYGEGTYVKISQDNHVFLKADQKVVKLHTFDTDTLKIETRDIPLEDYVCYNTIETLQNVSLEKAITTIEEASREMLSFGKEQTFIKLKLSNIFVSREMEIHKLLLMNTREHKHVVIEINYDKFVNNTSNSQVVQEILEEKKSEENSESVEITPVEFNDLVLSNEQLQKLFMHVLDSRFEKVVKEYANDKEFLQRVYGNVMNIFNKEISECVSGVRKTNIELVEVRCNSFMSLGENSIILNSPGITRISGTNGIGKTTLYNMLRWVLKDMVQEGLSKAQKKKNTLMVFNNKLPNIDDVVVRLFITVNNVPVEIIRTASRTWKRDVTNEQKLSLGWRDYISGVSTSLNIKIEGKNGTKEFVGDQAQMYIDAWFGEAPETIMFINYVKILQTLNKNPKELNDTILNFIGIDYLEKLENRLPEIKEDLIVSKPKRSRDDIRENLTILDKTHKDKQEELKSFEPEISSIENSIKEVETRIEGYNEDLQKLGDVEKEIIDNSSKLENLRMKISTFEKWEKKELVPLTINPPKEPDLSSLLNEKEKLSKEISNKKSSIEELENSKISIRENLVLNYQEVIKEITSTRDTIKNERDIINSKISEANTEIIKKQAEIKSGVCPTCNRPYENVDIFESKKIKLNEEIIELQNLLSVYKEDIKVKEKNLDLINNKLSVLNQACMYASSGKENYIIKDSLENNLVRKSLITNIVELSEEILKAKQEIISIENNTMKIDSEINNLNSEYKKKLDEYNSIRDENLKLNEDINLHNSKVEKHNLEIELLTKEYDLVKITLEKNKEKLPVLEELKSSINSAKIYKNSLTDKLKITRENFTKANIEIVNIENTIEKVKLEYEECVKYTLNNQIFNLYNTIIKNDFKMIIFEYYRNYLNNSLNMLLEDVNFKLFFNNDSELYMIDMSKGTISYTPCNQTSGMESVFLGLSLLYMMSVLNIKNSINLICVDELSGQLNDGKDLTYNAKDYCELFVSILSKFTEKNVMIVDHQVKNMFETTRYEVVGTPEGSKFELR